MKRITLTEEQQQALELLESGVNVFLTGKAGTGKSTVLAEFRRRTSKRAVYVAPTGIAALNIKGQTIHSCFQIKPGVMSDIGPLTSRKKFDLLSSLEVIVIDEISMVRSDLLTAIDVRMRQVAKCVDSGKPFGGRQVIVIGDFCQLPPVVEHSNAYQYLCMRYGGIFAFQSAIWEEARFHSIALEQVHRQADDRFISILNELREGRSEAIAELNNAVSISQPCSDNESIRVTPYRATADAINTEELSKLPEPSKKYTGELVGRFTKDLPVDQYLELRIGARVMFAANRYDKDGNAIYCNGELGVVEALSSDSVTVKRDDGRRLIISAYEWEMYEYDYSGTKVEAKVVGTYRQLPLRLAWAVTIHKSQGCTFDSMILDLGRGCFAEGQLYTALSRVRSLAGLSLTREIKPSDLKVDSAVVKLYRQN